MARDRDRLGANPFLRLQCEAWSEHSWEDAEQTAHPASQLVCSGDLQVISSGLLEGLVGELAATEDLLLPLASRPQGASSGELASSDRPGGSLSAMSRG